MRKKIEVLKRYQKRLINFNGRNQSLCRSKVIVKRAFDLNTLGEKLQQKVFSELFEDTANPILLVNNPSSIVLTKEEKEKINENIRKYAKNKEKVFEAHLTKEELESVKQGKEKFKEDAVNAYKTYQLEEKIAKERKLVKDLATLENTISSKKKETGLYELYVGLFYLEGRLQGGETIRAPLFLFPAKLLKQDGSWYYENLNDESIFINKAFLLAYKDSVGVSFDEVIGEYETLEEALEQEEITKENLSLVVEDYLKKIKINITDNLVSKDLEFKKYVDYTKPSYEKYAKGQLVLKNYLVLGEFSVGGNSIYNDYEELLKGESVNKQMQNFLFEDTEVSAIGEAYKKSIEIKEKESFFLTELDYSQEKAVKLAEDYENLVVYGPPGTGKSQVIANIVSSYLAKHKKVLVVSEKRTALDVVYKRLQTYGLGERLSFLHDIKIDYRSFMEKITSLLEEQKVISKSYEDRIEATSDKIEDKLKKLDDICNVLHSDTVKEISLFRLYSNSLLKGEIFSEILNTKDRDLNALKNNELKDALLKLKDASIGIKYDKDNWLNKRKNLASFGESELLVLANELKKINHISKEAVKDKTLAEIKEILNQLLNTTDIFYKNKIDARKSLLNKNENEIKGRLNKALEVLIQEEKIQLEVKLNAIKEKANNRNIKLEKEIISLEDFKDGITAVEEISDEALKNIDVWNDLKNRYEAMHPIIFWKKGKLKKQILNVNFGDSLEEKIKSISELARLKRNYKEDLNKITKVEKIKNKIQLLRLIEEAENKHKQEKELITLSLENDNLLDLTKVNEDELKILTEKTKKLDKKIKVLEKDLVSKNYLNDITLELSNFVALAEEKKAIEKNHKKDIDFLTGEKGNIKNLIINLNRINKGVEFIKEYDTLNKFELPIPVEDKKILEEFVISLNKFDVLVERILVYFHIEKKNFEEELFNGKELELDITVEYLEKELPSIISYDLKKNGLTVSEEKLFKFLFEKEDSEEVIKVLKNSFYLKWINEIEQEKRNKQILASISDYKSLSKESFTLINEKKKLIPEIIRERLDTKVNEKKRYSKAGKELYYKDILREANKKRSKLPLRQYIDKFFEKGLLDLLPCWLLTPEVASQILPLKEDLFDVVIYDEASQILVETAIPTIYRGKKIVVAGDDKQLQPSVLGKKRVTEDEEDEEELDEDTAVTEALSLLDLAKERYAHTLLSYHYRAKYPELINFSNYAFYDGKLVVAPSKEKLEKPPIERIMVENGVWTKTRNNKEETEAVYKLVKNLLINRKEKESIGVITFNASQQTYIREYLDYMTETDLEFRSLYEAEKNRLDETEDKSIFIKNIENVQGDERDIIIFSVGYAPDSFTGRVASRFGSLSQAGGENRLNVAISRAKKKCYLVTSIEPEALNVETTKNSGPKLLKKFLQYSRAVSDENEELANTILKDICIIENNKAAPITDSFDSPFEEQVCNALRDKGLEIHTQIGDSGYRIDLGVYSREDDKYILGIECDGAMYHSSKNARERDIYRQKFLEIKGWTIHRIWSKDWWRSPEVEIYKVLKVLGNLKSYG